LKHERQAFHNEVEVPCDYSFHLALPMPTAIDNGSAHLDLSVTIEPLLAQHGDERGEEGSGQAEVEDGLDVDDSGIGASPLRDGGVFGGGVPWRDTGNSCEELVVFAGNQVVGCFGRRK